MSLITVIVVLVVVGVLLYLINQYVPMSPNVKKILNIAVVVLLVIWLLKVAGLFHYLGDVKV